MSSFEPPEGPPPEPPGRPSGPPSEPPHQPPYQPAHQSPYQQHRRFAGGSVVLGVVAGLFGTPLVVVAVGVLVSALAADVGAAAALLVLAAVFAPPVAAVVVASKQGTPERRGFALGYAIGWAAFVIVGAGVCVAILSQLGAGLSP